MILKNFIGISCAGKFVFNWFKVAGPTAGTIRQREPLTKCTFFQNNLKKKAKQLKYVYISIQEYLRLNTKFN